MIENIINKNKKNLSETEKKIGKYIIENKNKIGNISSTELGEIIGVSQSTIIKFVKKLDFSGFSQFKIFLIKNSENKKQENQNKIHGEINLEDKLEVVTLKTLNENINALKDTVNNLDFVYFDNVINLIKESNKILIIGSGMSSIVAKDLELKLMKIKIDAIHYESEQMQLMKLSTMGEKDLVIAISHRGETKEIIEVLKASKKMKIKNLAITSKGKNSISELCDYKIGTISSEGLSRSTAISSRMAQLIILDSIFLRLVQKDYKKAKKYINKSKEIVESINK